MPVGVICNVLSIVCGGIVGAIFSDRIPKSIKDALNLTFSVCALAMGIGSVVLMQNMPAVIFSVIIGTAIGTVLHLGQLFSDAAAGMNKPIARIMGGDQSRDPGFLSSLVTIIVLFCASGTGIYGTLVSGMTGDHTILISKSILDFFTSMIFACNLGLVVSVIAVPQFLIFMVLFLLAKLIYPLTTPMMINDFKACGGILLLATGFRMMKLREFPVAEMLPAMVLVMPVSAIWSNIILPLL